MLPEKGGLARLNPRCEGTILRHIPQSPRYPLFLMVDLFEIGPPGGSYPKTAVVHRVRGWREGTA